MIELPLLQRIATDPAVMAGKPVVSGTRLTVEHILNILASGATVEEILGKYEGLVEEEIRACLLLASKSLADTDFMPLASGTA